MNARSVAATMFTFGWLAIVVVAAADNHGQVPGVLWPFLGFGVGTMLASFSHRPEQQAHPAREEHETCTSS